MQLQVRCNLSHKSSLRKLATSAPQDVLVRLPHTNLDHLFVEELLSPYRYNPSELLLLTNSNGECLAYRWIAIPYYVDHRADVSRRSPVVHQPPVCEYITGCGAACDGNERVALLEVNTKLEFCIQTNCCGAVKSKDPNCTPNTCPYPTIGDKILVSSVSVLYWMELANESKNLVVQYLLYYVPEDLNRFCTWLFRNYIALRNKLVHRHLHRSFSYFIKRFIEVCGTLSAVNFTQRRDVASSQFVEQGDIRRISRCGQRKRYRLGHIYI